ncbi:hypothetical protein D9758_002773 [Tetrapyrgos nigripes]|uniref:Uncharacterized protein n=1 Tax=Tetrapyrgos nigripes TaxID=182062 RepID=A0A8H5LTJ5_9AGAR|nr:hypothetical protein D9758_002773 [Tetrapyrgos nigripes]
MTILEIFSFDATDAYIADPTGILNLSESYSGLSGLLSFHHGPQIENSSKGTCFITWDKLESYQTAESRQSKRAQDLSLVVKGNSHIQVFDIGTADLEKIVGAPVTEINVMKLKEGKTLADLPPMFEAFKEGKKSTFVLLMGWDKIEDHLMIQEDPGFGAAIEISQSLVDYLGMHHAKLGSNKGGYQQ